MAITIIMTTTAAVNTIITTMTTTAAVNTIITTMTNTAAVNTIIMGITIIMPMKFSPVLERKPVGDILWKKSKRHWLRWKMKKSTA